jgi:hypothetical protein
LNDTVIEKYFESKFGLNKNFINFNIDSEKVNDMVKLEFDITYIKGSNKGGFNLNGYLTVRLHNTYKLYVYDYVLKHNNTIIDKYENIMIEDNIATIDTLLPKDKLEKIIVDVKTTNPKTRQSKTTNNIKSLTDISKFIKSKVKDSILNKGKSWANLEVLEVLFNSNQSYFKCKFHVPINSNSVITTLDTFLIQNESQSVNITPSTYKNKLYNVDLDLLNDIIKLNMNLKKSLIRLTDKNKIKTTMISSIEKFYKSNKNKIYKVN